MGRNTHTQLMECQAELAREREVIERAKTLLRDFQHAGDEPLADTIQVVLDSHGHTTAALEGRVRELQEALERKARKYHAEVHGWRFTKFEYCDRPECVETGEALVGLPERRERV